MSHKMLDDARLKAAVREQTHTLDFYMLAFSRLPDKQGDRIARDAADIWLKNFYAAGEALPISFTHAAVADPGNPFNVIGHAPADKQHVFKDEHGIRVIAELDTESNPTAAQVYSLAKRRIVTGASVFFYMGPDSQKVQKDGSTLITRIDDIIECGPCIDPANEDAYIIAVKSMEKVAKAVDGSEWDGNRAMSACSSAADYNQICAGKRAGDPSERQSHALPHHYLGRGPNAAGVRNALSRLPQTQGLTNAGAARSHLESHMREISPEAKAFITDVKVVGVEPLGSDSPGLDAYLKAVNTPYNLSAFTESLEPRSRVEIVIAKAGRAISAANRARIEAHLAELDEVRVGLMELLSSSEPVKPEANSEEPEEANEEEPEGPNDWLTKELERSEEILAASSPTPPE